MFVLKALLWVLNLLPERLKWALWWLARDKYLVGVFVAVLKFNETSTEILIVEKARGVSSGYQLPGGGKKRGVSPLQSAKEELLEETGLDLNGMFDDAELANLKLQTMPILANVYCNEPHRDINIVYAVSISYEPCLAPRDTLEIKRAFFVPLEDISNYLSGDHLKFVNDLE